jgi:hypothetical protein
MLLGSIVNKENEGHTFSRLVNEEFARDWFQLIDKVMHASHEKMSKIAVGSAYTNLLFPSDKQTATLWTYSPDYNLMF